MRKITDKGGGPITAQSECPHRVALLRGGSLADYRSAVTLPQNGW